jgi:hypothetical protein
VAKEQVLLPAVFRIRRIRKFLDLPDPDPSVFVRIRIWIRSRILPSSSKNSKNTLDFYCFVASLYDFLSVKNDVNVPSKKQVAMYLIVIAVSFCLHIFKQFTVLFLNCYINPVFG